MIAAGETRILVIGIIQLNETMELRCVHEPWGWRPDIIVNHDLDTVEQPPPCFRLNDDALGRLDAALAEATR